MSDEIPGWARCASCGDPPVRRVGSKWKCAICYEKDQAGHPSLFGAMGLAGKPKAKMTEILRQAQDDKPQTAVQRGIEREAAGKVKWAESSAPIEPAGPKPWEATRCLQGHDWSGPMRELGNGVLRPTCAVCGVTHQGVDGV